MLDVKTIADTLSLAVEDANLADQISALEADIAERMAPLTAAAAELASKRQAINTEAERKLGIKPSRCVNRFPDVIAYFWRKELSTPGGSVYITIEEIARELDISYVTASKHCRNMLVYSTDFCSYRHNGIIRYCGNW
jgi:Fic family protein